MAVLAAGMLLVGCSKDSEDNGMETKNGTEQVQTLTKEQIVGVWRSGDYWVSFSEDGYMSAYLSEKRIEEGIYTIVKDTVKAETSMYYHFIDFAVSHIGNAKLSCSVTLNAFDGSFSEKVNDYTFTKTDEKPCPKNHELIGKKFQYNTDVVDSDSWTGKSDTLHGFAQFNITTYFYADCFFRTEEGKRVGSFQAYYVYRPPLLYYRKLYVVGYNDSENVINILRIDIKNGNILASKI